MITVDCFRELAWQVRVHFAPSEVQLQPQFGLRLVKVTEKLHSISLFAVGAAIVDSKSAIEFFGSAGFKLRSLDFIIKRFEDFKTAS